MSSLSILMVEDHIATGRTLSKMLARRGHTVFTAATGAQAQALARDKKLDVLLTDLSLPDMSGWELLRALREMQPSLHAIAISGYGQPADIKRSEAAGFQRHLIKPVTMAEIEQALTEVPRAAAPATPSALRLLHLEDDPRDITLTQLYCEEDCGACEITAVSTPAEFLQALERGSYDGIISDSGVAGLAGTDALQLARARLPKIPFVFLCGMMSETRKAELLASQPDGIFSKDVREQVSEAFRVLRSNPSSRRPADPSGKSPGSVQL